MLKIFKTKHLFSKLSLFFDFFRSRVFSIAPLNVFFMVLTFSLQKKEKRKERRVLIMRRVKYGVKSRAALLASGSIFISRH